MLFRTILVTMGFIFLPFVAAAAENTCADLKPITGSINAEKVDLVAAFLDVCNREEKSIIIRVISDGGDAVAGLAIYEMLKSANRPVTTIAYGGASSAATLVFLAGKERVISCSSYMLIHEPYSQGATVDLTIAKARQTTQLLSFLNERYLDIYQKATGLSRDKLAAMVERETVLSSEEALKLGFATKRIGC